MRFSLSILLLFVFLAGCKVKKHSETSSFWRRVETTTKPVTIKGIDYRKAFNIVDLQNFPEKVPVLVSDPGQKNEKATLTRFGDSFIFNLITDDTTFTRETTSTTEEGQHEEESSKRTPGLPLWIIYSILGLGLIILFAWKIWRRK